jgi:putative transposase
MYMWRAVDSEGEVLEILVQPQRDKVAALRLLRKLLRHQGFVPTVIVTDEQGLRANNRRTRISRFDDANERCKASNQPNLLSASFRSMRPSPTRSMFNGI